MNLAQNWGMKDGLKYAARALTADDGGQPWIKAYAAQQIAQRSLQKDGKAEVRKYLPELVKALDSEGVISSVFLGRKNPNEAAVVQMRDYALGLLCTFTDQKPADYGLTPAPNSGNNINNYANWYFADPDKEKADDKRKAGIKKFKGWAEKNLKAEMEKKDPSKKGDPKGDAPSPAKELPVAEPARPIIKK
jgi:hypothetical protein